MVRLKQVLALVLVFGIALATSPVSAQDAQQQQQQQQPANLTPQEIDNLVAPIALYPDALVAQVLAASTYPNEVVEAAQWLKDNSGLQGQALGDAVNQQQWDPSVQALTQFPSVLDNMASNLSWTSALGSAFYNQQADVMASVQRLRAQAKAAGNLKSSSQMTVVQQDPQTIVIQPANPQVVYVPAYNPAVIYGVPYYPPYYSTGAVIATGLISFGVGFAIGAAMSGGWGWGWNNWGCGWRGGTVVYNRNVYVSRSNIYAGGNRYHNGSWARPVPYNNNYNRNNYYNNNRNNNYNNNYNRNNNNYNGNRPNNGANNGNRPSTLPANNLGNRPNNGVNNGNRPTTMPANQGNRPQNNQVNRPQNTTNNYRGYGQTSSPGTKTGAFSGYNNGGAARAESNRGRQSTGGGGGNRGGGGGRGGGGRR